MKSKAPARQAGPIAATAVFSAALAAAVAASSPARAADDGQGTILGSLMQIVGLKDAPATAPAKIDYRERPPLVLPRTMDLPPPARSAEARNPNWPRDPDAFEARKEAELARAPAQQGPIDPEMSVADMRKDRIPPTARTDYSTCDIDDDEQQCDPHQIWAALKTKKGDPGAIPSSSGAEAMVPGVEPTREYLTQPPPGYLLATQAVKPTWEAPKNRNADDNSNVYWMQQNGHNVTTDDPSDN
jgi:hypothetical protein